MKFLPHIQKTILPFYLAIFAVTNYIEISAMQRFITIYKVFISMLFLLQMVDIIMVYASCVIEGYGKVKLKFYVK